MRKLTARFMGVLLILLCITGLMVPASAFDSDAFREKNSDALEARGISLYGMHEFREGLMPVLVNDQWNYINEQLQVVDLNKNRFTYVFPFFDGLAAVLDDNGVGYIDKTGKLVIPCSFYTYDTMGTVYVGYFQSGTAPVLKEHVLSTMSGNQGTLLVGRIDRTGKLVQDYQEVDTLWGLSFVSDVGDRLDSAMELEPEPVPETAVSFVIDRYTPPMWVHNPDNDFHFSDGAAYAATVTNHTGNGLHSYYALVSYKPTLTMWTGTLRFNGQIHFFDVELAANETKQLIFASQFSNLASGEYRFLWLEFEDAAEMKEFQNNAPLDQLYGRVLDEKTGADWMKQELGITIQK